MINGADVSQEDTSRRTAPEILSDADVIDLVQAQIRQEEEAAASSSSSAASPVNLGEASLYYDAGTMAPLNPFAAAAVARLRSYRPPAFPLWDRLPARRRAAVLVLLYADPAGHLRVVITMRAASLRSFSGHAALPGGKADSTDESPYRIARREAWEEIGLPMDDARLPRPFRIEQLCCLPPSLARTHLVVQPCVAFLHAQPPSPDASPAPSVEETMIPRLDAREVAAVFTAPLYNFLKTTDLAAPPDRPLPAGHWYDGSWRAFKDQPWRVHNFHVPVNHQRVSKPRRGSAQDPLVEGLGDDADEDQGRYLVWGMTARILVDVARIAYAEEPEMEHNEHLGDEKIIMLAEEEGSLDAEPKKEGDGESAKM